MMISINQNLPPINIGNLLRKYDLSPKKSLGQNFLVDNFHLSKIVEVAEIADHEHVLEIGPGLGSLTRHLAKLGHQVIAVEIDQNFVPPLKEVLSPFENVKIVQGDILDQDLSKLISFSNYVVVANIPYYITSKLIRHLLESKVKPDRIILTIQEEVADRICEIPPDMNILALSVQVYGKPYKAARIPAGAFFPEPTVNSSVIRIDLYPEPLIDTLYIDGFFKLIKAGFSQRRKTLRNSLSSGLAISKDEITFHLQTAEIDSMRRAQTLSLMEWKRLTSIIADNKRESNQS